MHLMYFTEQPMSAYSEQAGRDFGATALMFPNKHFDPVAGSRLYNNYIEQYMLAEEVGIDGIMLNEHHNAPFCMQAKANIFAAILAGMTKKVKIVMLGNPLPLAENPIRLAEELAMIDMISKGRLVSGFVRGGGQEQLATGVNPAFNRERFEEAHDLIVKAWTQPGPFRFEGTHYQHRVVNPWAVPLQKPYPRVWIPGVISKETIVWAAQQRYPYIALNTSIEQTKKIWELYDQVALQVGLCRRPGESRLPDPGPCLRQRGEGDRERQAVPLDAGRVHRPCPSGVEHAVGLRLADHPPRLRRVRRRPRHQPARQHQLRAADGRPAHHRRHAQDGGRQAEAHPGGDAAGHPGAVGQRRQGQPGGLAHLHPADRPGGLPGDPRDRQEPRPQEPVRSQRAGPSQILDRPEARQGRRGGE